MTDLEKFEAVNACETVEELSSVVLSFANPVGLIKGRTRYFDAACMANNVKGVVLGSLPPNVLTRMYGIRQQALLLKSYI